MNVILQFNTGECSLEFGDDVVNVFFTVTAFHDLAGATAEFYHALRIQDNIAILGFLPLKPEGRGNFRDIVHDIWGQSKIFGVRVKILNKKQVPPDNLTVFLL